MEVVVTTGAMTCKAPVKMPNQHPVFITGEIPFLSPNCGEEIVSRNPRLKSAYDFLGLLYCFIVLYDMFVLHNTFHPRMAQYSVFVPKVQLNINQLT